MKIRTILIIYIEIFLIKCHNNESLHRYIKVNQFRESPPAP